MRVVIGTGGTAGHIFPALATATVLQRDHGAEVVFVGTGEGQESKLVPSAGFRLERIEALPFTRALSLRTVLAPVAALRASNEARRFVRGSDVVLGMGGYVSVPVSIAARRERVPLVVHEQNAVLGLANRLAARWSAAVALSYQEAGRGLPRSARATLVGNPVRERVAEGAKVRSRLAAEARRELGFEEDRRTILVTGGSQGAVRLNQAALEACELMRDRTDLQMLVVAGRRNHEGLAKRLPDRAGPIVRVVPFIERIEAAYALADLSVSRAGATTVAELTVSGVPAILVPYPYATANHQEANARAVERAGGALVLLDEQTEGRTLARLIDELLRWPDRLEAMARASASLGRPDAAERLAEVVATAALATRR